jgi:hypothetical protein
MPGPELAVVPTQADAWSAEWRISAPADCYGPISTKSLVVGTPSDQC